MDENKAAPLSKLKARYRVVLAKAQSDALAGALPAKEQLDGLSALEQLIRVSQAERSRRRTIVFCLMGCSVAAALVVLALLPRRQTHIELEAYVTGLSFTLKQTKAVAKGDDDSQCYLDGAKVDEIHAQDLTSVEAAQVFLSAAPIITDRVDLLDPSAKGGIFLRTACAPGGSRIYFAADKAAGHYRIAVATQPADRELVVQGRLPADIEGALSSRGMQREKARFGLASSLRLRAKGNLRIQLSAAADADFSFPPLRIDDLILQTEDHVNRENNTPLTVRRASVISGKLFLADLKKEITLSSNAQISFRALDGGIDTLRAEIVKAEPGSQGSRSIAGIILRFHGTVRNLRKGDRGAAFDEAGNAEGGISLMPSWLEWIAAQQRLVLIWSGVASGIGIATSLLKLLEAKK